MATLTIADLDNGKRDLQTVEAVANSREDFTQSRYGESVLTLAGALRRLGYQAPVPYASDLNVTTGLFTVERDGVVYAPAASRVPFTTGDWDESQWRVVQNTNDDRRAFIFSTKTEAVIAAATLPEGQFVDALDVQERYKVHDGELVTVEVFPLRADSFPSYTIEDFELIFSGRHIDLCGKTFSVSNYPTGNKYSNGVFNVAESGKLINAVYLGQIKAGNGRVAIGDRALSSFPDTWYPDHDNTGIVAIGTDSLTDMLEGRSTVAIGIDCMSKTKISFGNIAIGASALKNSQALTPWYDSSKPQGTRNIAIGGNAAYFNSSGYNNTAIGRNALHGTTTGINNLAIGSNTYSGYNVVGTTGEIENFIPQTGSNVTAVGNSALLYYSGSGTLTAIGAQAAMNLKKASSGLAIGFRALNNAESDISINGTGVKWIGTESGTYSQSGNSLTISVADIHGAAIGDWAWFTLTSGEQVTERICHQITSVGSGSFTVSVPASRTASGNVTFSELDDNVQIPNKVNNFTAIGHGASQHLLSGIETTSVGYSAGYSAKFADMSTIVGANTGGRALTVTESTLVGRYAGGAADSSTLQRCTALGNQTLNQYIDGSAITSLTNSTAIGFSARVSGSNQLQLGMSGVTTYAYGAVQDRSDARDKADVRDTVLGLDFINDLRPVDFKWDMRDDYVQTKEDGTVEILPKDGSKKRGRYHHGVIAQELRAVMEKHGVDFGGFQDHSVNGGCDVLSVGYTELIAPLIKAVQELSARVKELEER